MNAIVQKTRESRRGVYQQHLYIVKEDGEPPLRLWALSCLIQDRADVLPSYQQFISQLKDKVSVDVILCVLWVADAAHRLTAATTKSRGSKRYKLFYEITYCIVDRNDMTAFSEYRLFSSRVVSRDDA